MALEKDALALAHTLRDEQPLAFVGAGTSARLQYPTWSQLLEKMAAEVNAKYGIPMAELGRYDDLLWRAEEYRTFLREEYQPFLQQTFPKCTRTDPALRALVRLPFRHMLTTNYDDVLECAHREVFRQPAEALDWSDEEKLRNFLWMVGDRVTDYGRRQYLHVHGCITNPASIVLTDQDYTRRYVASDVTQRKLFAILATQRVVFVGFGLSDPDFMEILRVVKHSMGSGAFRHYAIVPVGPKDDRAFIRRRLKEKFGVAPVFYEESGDHTGLAVLIAELQQAIRPAQNGSKATLGGGVVSMTTPSAESEKSPPPTEGGRPPINPEDCQKGQWGGLAERDGRVLSATVKPLAKDTEDWFRIRIEVRAMPNAKALTGTVTLHLHESFDDRDPVVEVINGVAAHDVIAFGAFTVGAEVDGGATQLELDLAELPSAPKAFRER